MYMHALPIKHVSIVIPCFNSAATLGETVRRIRDTLANRFELEFILVNDGSADNTWQEILNLQVQSQTVKSIDLMRNFGEHNAAITGLRFVSGDTAIIVDDDLQHPASEILKLLDELAKGYDVVYGRYIDKQHSLWRNIGSSLNDKLATILLNKPKSLYMSSFKAMRRPLVDAVCAYDGPFVYIDGLIFWTTENIGQVDVEHTARSDGRSNYNIRRLVRLHLNLATGFSVIPLRVASLSGVVMAVLGAILAAFFVYEKLTRHDLNIPIGWASTIVCLLVIGGIVLAMLGIIGEYVGRIFLSLNRKPQSVIREVVETE
ncbi:MAG TPA: glycosyltransferase [Lentisphaeria bacterium]|nr:glycosyltransferase [Lentisphaeria bacterium]|tara:strand:+ start:527 stop:1477 length:951 start_codon:yes stop_codon:yes gene_type:complete